MKTHQPGRRQTEALAGRLRWLDAQTFGLVGRWAFRTVLEHGMRPGKRRSLQLTEALRASRSWILDNVPKAEPRSFRLPRPLSHNVFTDGSFENGEGRIGGVLCSANGKPWKWFQASVPADIVRHWCADGTVHPILQCTLCSQCSRSLVGQAP